MFFHVFQRLKKSVRPKKAQSTDEAAWYIGPDHLLILSNCNKHFRKSEKALLLGLQLGPELFFLFQ